MDPRYELITTLRNAIELGHSNYIFYAILEINDYIGYIHHNEYDDLPPLVEIDLNEDSEYDDLPPLIDDEHV